MRADAVLVSGSHHRAEALRSAIERAGWRLRVYLDPAQALQDIRERPYNAIFCDETLKGASMAGFLLWHDRLNPTAPFFAIPTAGGELATALRGRPTQVLPYPLSPEAVPPPPESTLWRQREENPVIPLEGDTNTVPLSHLVELLGVSAGSAVVETPAGVIHLANGRIEHASWVSAAGTADAAGLSALADLIAAEELSFRVLPYRLPPQRSVNMPIMMALTEAARQRDERARNQRLLAAVEEAHPHAIGLAVGYPWNAAPDDLSGEGAAAHGLVNRYVDATRGIPALAKPSHLALEGEGVAWALLALRNGLVLSGTTARGRSLSLLTAMVKCARALESETD